MEAVPEQMSAALGSLVNDIQDQLSVVKKGQTTLLKEIEGLHGKQQLFSDRISTLSVKVQKLAYPAIKLEDNAPLSRHLKPTEAVRQPQPAAETFSINPAIGTTTHEHHQMQKTSQNLSADESGKRPCANRRSDAVNYDEFMHGAMQSALMLPPRRHVREPSIASSVTLCGDDDPAESILRVRPPPAAARLGIPVAPSTRIKREQAHDDALASIENGSNKRRRNAPSSSKMLLASESRSGLPTITPAEEERVPHVENTDVAGAASDQQTKLTKVAEDEFRVFEDPVSQLSFDSDEIVVARRKSKADATQVEPTDSASSDHATLATELLKSVEIGEQAPGSTRQGPSPPPKTLTPLTLSAMHKQFGVRSDDKENVAPTAEEPAKDAIAYKTLRRSRRAPKPKKLSDE